MSKLQNIADGTEWQNVKRKKPNNKRPAPMQGTATGTNIKAGMGPNRDLWIYNVHHDIEDDELRDFIENGGGLKQQKVEIRRWEARYKDYYEYKCFRLTISKKDYEYVFNPTFWPMDIHFRKYWLDKEEFSALKSQRNNSITS